MNVVYKFLLFISVSQSLNASNLDQIFLSNEENLPKIIKEGATLQKASVLASKDTFDKETLDSTLIRARTGQRHIYSVLESFSNFFETNEKYSATASLVGLTYIETNGLFDRKDFQGDLATSKVQLENLRNRYLAVVESLILIMRYFYASYQGLLSLTQCHQFHASLLTLEYFLLPIVTAGRTESDALNQIFLRLESESLEKLRSILARDDKSTKPTKVCAGSF